MRSFFLKKILPFIRSRRKSLALLSLSAFAVLLLPNLAEAQQAVAQRLDPLLSFDVIVLIIFGISGYLLSVSQALLETVVAHTTIWLDVLNAPYVQIGWHFIASIVNSAFIVVFLLVAFSIMFQWGNIQPKKILLRLVLVAVLINFTLLFVQAGIDIVNIAYSTFLFGPEGGTSVTGIKDVLDPVFEAMSTAYYTLLTIVILSIGAIGGGEAISAGSSFLPIAGGVGAGISIAGIVGAVLGTVAFLPELVLMLIVGIAAIITAIVLVLLSILLLLRVFIISLLAIISPFAFAALIFPQTRQYFDIWGRWLIRWLFVGLIILFTLSIALAVMVGFATAFNPTFEGGTGWLAPEGFVSILMYVVTFTALMGGVLYVSVKTTPVASKFIAGALSGGVAGVAAGALAGISGVGITSIGKKVPWVREKFERNYEARREKMEKEMEELKDKSGAAGELASMGHGQLRGLLDEEKQKGVMGHLRAEGLRFGSFFRRSGYDIKRAVKASDMNIQEQEFHKEKEEIEQETKNMEEKLDTPQEVAVAAEKRNKFNPRKRMIETASIMRAAYKKGSENWQAANSMLSPNEKMEAISHLQSSGYKKEAEQMAVASGFTNKQIESALGVSQEKKEKMLKEGRYQSVKEKLVAEIKPKDIENLSHKVFTDPQAQRAMLKHWNSKQIEKAIEHHGRKFSDVLQTLTKEITNKTGGIEALIGANPGVARYMHNTSAVELGVYNNKIQSIPKKKFDKMVNEVLRSPGAKAKGDKVVDEVIDGQTASDESAGEEKEEGAKEKRKEKKRKKSYSDSGEGGQRDSKSKERKAGDTGESGERK